jgi:superfamily I DNA/RNA helicase
LLAGTSLKLKENFRNPRNIVSEMCRLLATELPICRRLLSSNVDYQVYVDERDQAKKLRAVLVELLRQGIRPGDITILSGKARETSSIARFPPDIGKEVIFIEAGEVPPIDAISACTVSAFKGLENEIIVLTDLPSIDPRTDWSSAVLYVGMTRARTKLVALVDEVFLHARERY